MRILDARGKSCPLPIVLAAKLVRELPYGETFAVRADDRAFPEDIRAWCTKTGLELVSFENLPGFFEAHVRKR